MKSKLESFLEGTTCEYEKGPRGGSVRVHKKGEMVVALVTKWTINPNPPLWVTKKYGPFTRCGGTTYKWSGWIAAGLQTK
jgi:hypothetical protein